MPSFNSGERRREVCAEGQVQIGRFGVAGDLPAELLLLDPGPRCREYLTESAQRRVVVETAKLDRVGIGETSRDKWPPVGWQRVEQGLPRLRVAGAIAIVGKSDIGGLNFGHDPLRGNRNLAQRLLNGR